jgi:hypothetical protein
MARMFDNIRYYKITILLIVCLSFMGCQQNEAVLYQPTKQDSLNYLVTNSDLIAIINTTDGHKRFTNEIDFSKLTFHSEVVHQLHGQAETNIVIDVSPEGKSNQSYLGAMALIRRGDSLAFLKKISGNKFRPLSEFSVITIYDGILSPVWKTKQGTSKFGGFEFALDEILSEVKAEISKR